MKEEKSENNLIYYNKSEILNELKNKGKYEQDSTLIIKWEDDIIKNNDKYAIKITSKNDKEKIIFIGIINSLFKREGFCVNNYLNDDIYFGYYLNDLRNKQGLYIYKPKIIILNNNIKNILYQYYFGLWKNDIKNERGIYIWIKDEYNINNIHNNNNLIYNPFINFSKANFQAYIGNITNNNFTKGTLLKKEGNNYFLYYGTLSKDLKKEGDKCFYYSAKLEELFYGKYKNDIFIEGYVTKFNNEGNVKDIIKFKDKKIINKKELEKNENIKNICDKMNQFRNIIMSKDYFGILFNIFKDIIDFKNNNMNDINIFNSDKYSQLMEISFSFNKETISQDIENNLII